MVAKPFRMPKSWAGFSAPLHRLTPDQKLAEVAARTKGDTYRASLEAAWDFQMDSQASAGAESAANPATLDILTPQGLDAEITRRTKGPALRDRLEAAWDVIVERDAMKGTQPGSSQAETRTAVSDPYVTEPFSPSERAKLQQQSGNLPSLFGNVANANTDEEKRKQQWDHLYWNVDLPTCRAIEARRGKRAAAICHHSAAARYGSCLGGTPIEDLPPLATWNN